MTMSLSTKALSVALLLAYSLTPHCLAGQERGDIAILGGRVVDPASGLSAVRNVVIQGDRIVAITDSPVAATRTIDARGLVAPPWLACTVGRWTSTPGIDPLNAVARWSISGRRLVMRTYGGQPE